MSTIFAGMGHHLPPRVVSSEEIEDRFREKLDYPLPRGMIERLTGIKERRWVTKGVYPSDLAFEASKKALTQAQIDPSEVDTIIFAACTKDIIEPATANIVQEKLRARKASVFDIQNACNSFLNAVDIMDSFIKGGKSQIGLVATGEVLSPFIDWEIRKKEDLETKFAGLTLGDGGGAVVLKADNGTNRGIQSTLFKSAGDHWRLATVMGYGSITPEEAFTSYFYSNSIKLMMLAFQEMPRVVKKMLKSLGWTAKELDLIFSHQVSERMIFKLCQLTGISPKICQFGLRKYGNTGAASIPISLCEAQAQGLIKPNTRGLLIGGASGFSTGVISVIW